MFSQRHRGQTTSRLDGDGPSDAAEAEAVAKEIASMVVKDKPVEQKDHSGVIMAVVLIILLPILLYAPMPWDQPAETTAPVPLQQEDTQRVNKMVADCTHRLKICQAQLHSCQSAGGCSEKIITACRRLTELCVSVNGAVGGPVPEARQQAAAQAAIQTADHPPRSQQQQHGYQQPQQASGQQQTRQQQGQLFGQQQQQQQPMYQQELSNGKQQQQHKQQTVYQQSTQGFNNFHAAAAQQGAGVHASGSSCKEQGTVLPGGQCLCPALTVKPFCTGTPAPGTCACQNGQTTPFEHMDHVKKLIKRELPQSFTGPAVLAQDNENVKGGSGIKVHLPGKQPAWKKIGKISEKEANKWLPGHDPVGGRIYKSCAVVGSSGMLLLEDKGKEIDDHEFVMRFNGAPTKGLERFVGRKTTVRIVNHSWQDFRESKDEIVLSHLRGPHHLEDFKLRRQAKGATEKWFLFSPEFSNYAAQTAYEVATYFNIDLQAEGSQAWTPTGGWTGIVMAINLCAKVDIYGFHISERHGVPYHYHNRCPQPFMHRDVAEWLMVQSFKNHGLIDFRDPCVFECHASDEECQACKAQHPVPRSVYEEGKALWQKGPMPEYCSVRLDWLKKEEKAGRCSGLCGKFEKTTDWGRTAL